MGSRDEVELAGQPRCFGYEVVSDLDVFIEVWLAYFFKVWAISGQVVPCLSGGAAPGACVRLRDARVQELVRGSDASGDDRLDDLSEEVQVDTWNG